MKTKLFLLGAVAAALSFTACQKNTQKNSFLTVDRTPLAEDPKGQTDSFVVNSNIGWTLTKGANSDWFTVDKTSGNSGTTKVYVTASANSTASARSGSVLISGADGMSTATVTISQALVTNTWTKVSDAVSGFDLHNNVTFVYNNQAYVGMGTNTPYLNTDFKIFDPATGLFTAGPLLPAAMSGRNDASIFVLGNKAYMGFGTNTTNSLSDWWELDLTKTGDAAWRQIASYPVAGSGGVAFAVNGQGYAGVPAQNGNLSMLDVAANTWTTVVSGSFPKVSHSSIFTIGNVAYIAGGMNTSGTNVNTVYKFDPSTNTVTPVANAPVAFKDAPSFVLNNKAYVLVNGTTYMYDAAANTWSNTNANSVVFNGAYDAIVLNGNAYAGLPNGTLYRFYP